MGELSSWISDTRLESWFDDDGVSVRVSARVGSIAKSAGAATAVAVLATSAPGQAFGSVAAVSETTPTIGPPVSVAVSGGTLSKAQTLLWLSDSNQLVVA